MKKLLVFVLALVAVLGLASCGKAAVNPDKDYYAVGQFQGWSVGKAESKMEAVSSVKGLKIKGAKYIYALEVTFSAEKAGWEEAIKGGDTFDGNLSIKVVRTAAGDPESVDFWAENKESGEVKNLTPETLFVPAYHEEDLGDGMGTWGGNTFVRAAGTYTIVFVEFADGTLGMGAVAK